MRLLVNALLLALAAAVGLLLAAAENDVDLTLDVEHSVDGAPFTARTKLKYVLNKQERKLSLKFEPPAFTYSKDQAQALAKGWLSVRIPAVDGKGQVVPDRYLTTSIRGCALLQDPKEVFSLLTDKTGALMGLQYDRPLIPDCNNVKVPQDKLEVLSKISASLPKEVAALPLPRLESQTLDSDATEKQEQQPPQGFLQQYWYIILPSILVYTLLTAPQGPEEEAGQQAQQGQSGAGAAAGAAGAAGAAAAASGQVRRRKQ